MKNYYQPDMLGLKVAYYTFMNLCKKFIPKIHAHMMEEMFTPNVYTTCWFMTMFTSKVPHKLTLRIWDMYFIEGHKIIFRVAMAILKLNEKKLL